MLYEKGGNLKNPYKNRNQNKNMKKRKSKKMTGLLFIPNAIVVGFVVAMFFGAVCFDLLITGSQCLSSFTTGFSNCNNFLETVGGALFAPDEKIYSGVVAIQDIQQNPDMFSHSNELSSLIRGQILTGLFILAIYAFIIIMVIIKLTPSSTISLSVKIMAIMFVILLFITVQFAYIFFVKGETAMPFRGVISLIQHPEVMSDIIDDTGALPVNATTKDIIPNGEESPNSDTP